ncbi:MAG: hypothetical protein KC636_18525, partial [Myxococcales bacterium]|nr:hypothetical protein [Myxococcales bacterium]
FWPTNGSADDGAIRLPPAFRETDDGVASRAVYKINLAILEAAVSAPPGVATAALDRKVEPIDERVAQLDLDGDGAIRGVVTRLRGLPARYVGAAAAHPVRRGLYPEGVEFLHSVRYLDPESLTYAAVRMKELRYARKEVELDDAAIREVYAAEEEEEHDPAPPVYEGSPELGYRNDFGWRLQGYIEDVDGRLRLQSAEEHRFCMGCHSTVGVTVDQTFSFPRKVPGEGGWRPQALQGIPDVPQAGHTEPEILTYFRRVGGGDELRANDELLTRFFRGGVLDEEAVRRAAPGGAVDIQSILLPSRGRALALDKAYWLIVREQSFHLGRDPVIAPAENVHRAVESGETELKAAGVIYRDGRAQLDWSGV